MCFFASDFSEFLWQTWHSDFSEALPDASWLHFCSMDLGSWFRHGRFGDLIDGMGSTMFTAPPTGSFANMTMEECPQRKRRNLDFLGKLVEIRLFKKINGWLAVFKWTKTTFRQRFLKRLSKSLECWPRWRNTQHCKQMEWWPRCHRCDATSFASEELSTTPSMGRSPLGSHGVLMFEDHFGIRWAILLWSSSCFLETIDMLSFESENPASHDEYLISIERQISQYLSPAYHLFITFFC